ncbi:MAG: aldolase/citrate lyase family protein [Planctomycetota bacterium]|nr:aldolase/citrate lyase family protein [Planctomycetota bacterium]MDA1213621.1 aldolase/citrate lyase family protein [Planctomycetota bacterium]
MAIVVLDVRKYTIGTAMKSAQILRDKINSQQLTLGMLVTLHLWPDFIEIAQRAGLDYLILDGEHGPHDAEQLATACSIGRMIDFPILIRPAESDYRTVRFAADLGPCGFLLPQVKNSQMLDDVRDGLYLPPRGKRRPGGHGNRWTTDYTQPAWAAQVENDWIVLPQIESQEGLDNADAIANHEITTAIAIGPYDLSADLGVCGELTGEKMFAVYDQIREAGRRAEKNMWMIGDGPTLQQRGFTFLCIGEPVTALEGMIRTNVTGLRKSASSPA